MANGYIIEMTESFGESHSILIWSGEVPQQTLILQLDLG